MKDDTTHSTIAQPEAETAVYLFRWLADARHKAVDQPIDLAA